MSGEDVTKKKCVVKPITRYKKGVSSPHAMLNDGTVESDKKRSRIYKKRMNQKRNISSYMVLLHDIGEHGSMLTQIEQNQTIKIVAVVVEARWE